MTTGFNELYLNLNKRKLFVTIVAMLMFFMIYIPSFYYVKNNGSWQVNARFTVGEASGIYSTKNEALSKCKELKKINAVSCDVKQL